MSGLRWGGQRHSAGECCSLHVVHNRVKKRGWGSSDSPKGHTTNHLTSYSEAPPPGGPTLPRSVSQVISVRFFGGTSKIQTVTQRPASCLGFLQNASLYLLKVRIFDSPKSHDAPPSRSWLLSFFTASCEGRIVNQKLLSKGEKKEDSIVSHIWWEQLTFKKKKQLRTIPT